MISKHEIITLALVVLFGLIGAWLYNTGNDWLANLCMLPPAIYGIIKSINWEKQQ